MSSKVSGAARLLYLYERVRSPRCPLRAGEALVSPMSPRKILSVRVEACVLHPEPSERNLYLAGLERAALSWVVEPKVWFEERELLAAPTRMRVRTKSEMKYLFDSSVILNRPEPWNRLSEHHCRSPIHASVGKDDRVYTREIGACTLCKQKYARTARAPRANSQEHSSGGARGVAPARCREFRVGRRQDFVHSRRAEGSRVLDPRIRA
jgi:hypothetical protein